MGRVAVVAGSAAEERIREKAEAMLRRALPQGRIIHELVLTQGGVRIDLACVTEDAIFVVEIKSEKDTLTRLAAQLTASLKVANRTYLCAAPKWDAEIKRLGRSQTDERVPHRYGYSFAANPDYLADLGRAVVLIETDDGFAEPRWGRADTRVSDSRALLNMLWADELRRLTGQPPRASRGVCIAWAYEFMTHRAIRRGVCKALRARGFPRADPAVAWAAEPLAIAA
jgi:hypothetical protein